jgi:hypothetical protein
MFRVVDRGKPMMLGLELNLLLISSERQWHVGIVVPRSGNISQGNYVNQMG